MHSFALTENYAVIFKAPIYFKNMMVMSATGHPMKDMFTQDKSDTTKLYVISLKDGQVKEMDSKFFFFAVHFGQMYEKENGEIVIEVPTTTDARVLVDTYLRENYNDLDFWKGFKQGSRYNRFTFDFEKGTVDIKDLFTVDQGSVDLPQYNKVLKGQQAQYTYLSHVWASQQFDENLGWPLVKYDDKLGGIAAQWAPK